MPISLQLAEPIADAMIAKLQTGLGARIATINDADTNGITLAVPQLFFVGGTPDGLPPTQPAIVVTELPGDQDWPESSHSFVYTTHFLVYVFELDHDRQVLGRRLWRQARAFTEVLWDDDPRQRLADIDAYVMPKRVRPGPVFDPTEDKSMWSGLYGVVFKVQATNG